jgi:hypothetical protein
MLAAALFYIDRSSGFTLIFFELLKLLRVAWLHEFAHPAGVHLSDGSTLPTQLVAASQGGGATSRHIYARILVATTASTSCSTSTYCTF